MLAVAVAADDIRTMLRHALPEEARNVVVALLPCQFVFAGCAYGFRYLSVCVQAVERIFAAGQRVKDGPVVEFLRHAQVLRIAGDGVQVCQHLVHAAEFGIERGLLLLIAQTVDAELDPIGLFHDDIERLPVPAEEIHVQESGHDLVDCIIRRPDAPPGVHPVEKLFGERRQITRMEAARRHRLLNLDQFGDNRVGFGLEPFVTGARIHQRAGGQKVAEAVAAQLDIRGLPPSQRPGRRRQPRRDAEHVQEPVGVDTEQVLLVAQHGVEERAVKQAHVLEIEGGCLDRDFALNFDPRVFLHEEVSRNHVRRGHKND